MQNNFQQKHQEQISAALDGELTDTEWAQLSQEWSEQDHQALNLHAAVGDTLRASSLAAFHNPRALSSIYAAIAAEPTVLAPTLRTAQQKQQAQKAALAPAWRYLERAALCGLAVFTLATSLHQALPVQMSDIQMAKVASQNTSHFSNAANTGRYNEPSHVNVSNQAPTEWMNVWEHSNAPQENVYFHYVSSIH